MIEISKSALLLAMFSVGIISGFLWYWVGYTNEKKYQKGWRDGYNYRSNLEKLKEGESHD